MHHKTLKREGNTIFDVSNPRNPVVFAYRYKGDWYRPERDKPADWAVIEGRDRGILEELFEEAA